MKLWGGRFEKGTNAAMDDFHSSIRFDQRLYRQDIEGSIAHATMLGEQGIIPAEDARAIVKGLLDILADIEADNVTFDVSAEDIHMNIETLLIERIGEAGKRLHTGRSRNDQVALDSRIYVRDICGEAIVLLRVLCDLLLEQAEAHLNTYMPGYTHLQKAQPITWAHHQMAYFQMFSRDMRRFTEARVRANVMPLGSGALAGTTYPLDRMRVAQLLSFPEISMNSLDAVSDRDFMLDYLYAATTTMGHLSRFCEEIILYASHEFSFLELDDAYSTGSSIMPQKKNPDVAELVRGKSGRVFGDLMALLTVMKSLPLAYNKDMQEDKEALFDARDTLAGCLTIFTEMLRTTRVNAQRMEQGALGGFANATDAADYLVGKGMPFRQAHEVVGRLVLDCIHRDKALLDLSLTELQAYSDLFGQDVFEALSLSACVSRRNVPGGPAPVAVLASIQAGRNFLAEFA